MLLKVTDNLRIIELNYIANVYLMFLAQPLIVY